MIKFLSLMLLLITTNNLFSQVPINSNLNERIFAVFKTNADNTLKKQVDSLFEGTNDSIQKARKVTRLEYYQAQLLMVDRKLTVLLAKDRITSNEFIKLAFEEFRKNIPDLPEDFYNKSMNDIKKL